MIFIIIYIYSYLYLCIYTFILNENFLKPCKMFIYVCMYACVYKFHSLKAMQDVHLCMHVCMHVCIYKYIYVSQGDFRLMSFTAGRCGTPLIPNSVTYWSLAFFSSRRTICKRSSFGWTFFPDGRDGLTYLLGTYTHNLISRPHSVPS